jgi:hypothetical protein
MTRSRVHEQAVGQFTADSQERSEILIRIAQPSKPTERLAALT